MPVPVLQLNLAPRPSLWRQHHAAMGWAALGLGTAVLLGTLGFTWRAYYQAGRAGREAVSLTEETRRAAQQEQRIKSSLQEVDAEREQSRWKLAERILQERSLPWSRLTAELEQCMTPGMRLKGLQRTLGSAQQVVMKLKAEARTREAEAAFVEALKEAPIFSQVVLERESERAGGGWDFEISLPAAPIPPPFTLKPVKTGAPGSAQATVAAAPKPPPPQAVRSATPTPARTPPPAPPPAASPSAGLPSGVRTRPLPDDEEPGRRPRPRLGLSPREREADDRRPR